ncbi:MAG TPA: acyltransferase family protein [Candidatus Sulfotelmatobacter sp.]|nr:acyltransferase family protein [Candidatus Sulfotelmatobacter sp.]
MNPSAILSTSAATRYHALDGMRGAMMLLGIYLHVACAYATIGNWPYKQPDLTPSLNATITLIHVFRMPAFYMMAGFFTALLYARRGFAHAAANRLRRIGLPFVVGWLILFPLVVGLIAVSKGGLRPLVVGLPPAPWWTRFHPMHLWFLEYLLVLYVLAAVAVPAVRALPAGWRARFTVMFRGAIEAPGGLLLLAVPSALALMPMGWAGLDDPSSFVPQPHIVIAYAIPFAVGWLLYLNADLLDVLRRRAWGHAILAAAAAALYLALLYTLPDRGAAFVVKRAAHALAMWLMIFGVTGLFLRYLRGHHPAWRYLCDSSYFLYIAHMPVIMALQLLLAPVALAPLVKVAIVLVAGTAALLVLYHYTVRPTFIGAALNGRRYPIGRAAIADVVAA